MRKRFLPLLLVASMLLMILATGCANQSPTSETAQSGVQQEAPKIEAGTNSVQEGKTITDEQVDNITIVLPQASFELGPFSSGRVTSMVWYMLYSTLMSAPYPGATLDEMMPRLAKSCTQVDDTVYEVELYNYIHDSKGNAITAEDVVFSMEYGKSIGSFTCLTSELKSVEAIDDYHVRITTNTTTKGVIEQLLDYPRIIDKDWFENASDVERVTDPATTGAYTVANVVSGSSFVLVANDDFWQTDENERSYIDSQNVKQLTFTAITEMAMVAVALENGEVDLAEIDGSVADYFVENGQAKGGYSFMTYAVNKFNCLEFNCSDESPLNNQYLRLAIAYALDNEELMLAANVPLGMGTVCSDFGNSVGSGYNAAWDSEDYFAKDLDKAREYMELSGYGDGVQLHLLFAISTAPNLAISIQAQLAEIGIDVVIDAVEQALYNSMELDPTQWDMRTRLQAMDDSITSGWAARFDENVWGKDGTSNWVHDDKLQELLHAAMQEQSAETIDAFHYYLMEQCYAIGLYTANKCYVGQEDVLNIGGTYQACPLFNNIDFTTDYVSCINK